MQMCIHVQTTSEVLERFILVTADLVSNHADFGNITILAL